MENTAPSTRRFEEGFARVSGPITPITLKPPTIPTPKRAGAQATRSKPLSPLSHATAVGIDLDCSMDDHVIVPVVC
jgi:hypothetical protein